MIYLDYAATSPLLPEVKKAMLDAMDNYPGNASALHTPGHLAHEKIEETRGLIAELINASPEEILFTSGGSESNNSVIGTFTGQNIAVSAIEHPSVLEPAKLRTNAEIIPVDKKGFIKKVSYDNHPKLVSVMLANNELGSIEPIQKLAKEAHEHGALFHTDATQALSKIKIDVKKLGVDYMTMSAHKIGGPVGVSALYIKKGSPFEPLIIGGHQEHGKRAGTYNTVGLVGFGAAVKFVLDNQTWNLYKQQVKPLRDNLANRILNEVPFSNLNTDLEHSLPNILNMSFAAAEGESIQLYLDANSIAVSTGSACASGDGKPSHVFMATVNDAEVAHSSIRFSFGLDSNMDDIEHVMASLPSIISQLQQISTVKIKEEHGR